jgi:hypothetical protein
MIYAYSDSDRSAIVAQTETDANGNWNLYFSASGTYYLRAVIEEYAPLEWIEVVT